MSGIEGPNPLYNSPGQVVPGGSRWYENTDKKDMRRDPVSIIPTRSQFTSCIQVPALNPPVLASLYDLLLTVRGNKHFPPGIDFDHYFISATEKQTRIGGKTTPIEMNCIKTSIPRRRQRSAPTCLHRSHNRHLICCYHLSPVNKSKLYVVQSEHIWPTQARVLNTWCPAVALIMREE